MFQMWPARNLASNQHLKAAFAFAGPRPALRKGPPRAQFSPSRTGSPPGALGALGFCLDLAKIIVDGGGPAHGRIHMHAHVYRYHMYIHMFFLLNQAVYTPEPNIRADRSRRSVVVRSKSKKRTQNPKPQTPKKGAEAAACSEVLQRLRGILLGLRRGSKLLG